MSKYIAKGAKAPLWVSQNFLTSRSVIHSALSKTTLGKRDHVIEIGPGKGHITEKLACRAKRVTAVELDGGLFAKLALRFAGADNVVLIQNDFLRFVLPKSGGYKVFSSIPFSITTAIVRKLTEAHNPPTEAWLVMEKGAAKRFMGTPRESLRSLVLKPFFEMEIVFRFSREDFHPKPACDVVMLQLKRKARPDIPLGLRPDFERFVQAALSGGLYRLLSKKQVSRALKEAGLSNDVVPEEMRYIQWLCLFRCYARLVLQKPS